MVDSVAKPTMLLREGVVRENVRAMGMRCAASGATFRPHFKTHQSAEIAEWFRSVAGARCAAVSSVDMAEYFAAHGWDDLLIAFVVNPRQIAQINTGPLSKIGQLGLIVDSHEALATLTERLAVPNVSVWVEIDVGQKRTGVPSADRATVVGLAKAIAASAKIRLAGLLTHAGQTYHAVSKKEVADIHAMALATMRELRGLVQTATGLSGLAISYGDTPSLTMVDDEDLAGWTELRPGNFVFFDAMQLQLGSCQEDQLGLAVACPVVSVRRNEATAIVYGGSVHLSKEFIEVDGGKPCYGLVALPDARMGWDRAIAGARVVSLTQEHGVVQFASSESMPSIHVGDILVVIPVHSCLVVPLLFSYTTLDGRIIRTSFSQ
jgi:D-serine deaminase-like pyridoxal phosphate-dependent protein